MTATAVMLYPKKKPFRQRLTRKMDKYRNNIMEAGRFDLLLKSVQDAAI
jgi:hypothetical protein